MNIDPNHERYLEYLNRSLERKRKNIKYKSPKKPTVNYTTIDEALRVLE